MRHDTCLVVCFYRGKRKGNQHKNFKSYIKTQKASLNKFKNNLSRIVFVISQDKMNRRKEVKEVDGITYYYRKNRNLSFGGWVDAAKKFKHDYYIFLEDDYVFCKDNFDTIMIDNYIKKNCEYMVNWKQLPQSNSWKDKNDDTNFELISTVGAVSSKYINRFIGFNARNMGKVRAMCVFLKTFNTITSLNSPNDGFIYWEFGRKEWPFSSGNGNYFFSNTHPNGFYIDPEDKKVNASDIDFAKIILSSYQFYIKHTNLFIY